MIGKQKSHNPLLSSFASCESIFNDPKASLTKKLPVTTALKNQSQRFLSQVHNDGGLIRRKKEMENTSSKQIYEQNSLKNSADINGGTVTGGNKPMFIRTMSKNNNQSSSEQQIIPCDSSSRVSTNNLLSVVPSQQLLQQIQQSQQSQQQQDSVDFTVRTQKTTPLEYNSSTNTNNAPVANNAIVNNRSKVLSGVYKKRKTSVNRSRQTAMAEGTTNQNNQVLSSLNNVYTNSKNDFADRKRSFSGYNVLSSKGMIKQTHKKEKSQNGTVSGRRNSNNNNTQQDIQQTRANIEKMLQKKQENAAQFAQKLEQRMNIKESKYEYDDDIEEYDEKKGAHWQLSLRPDKQPRISGSGRPGGGGQNTANHKTKYVLTRKNSNCRERKDNTPVKARNRQIMFQQPAMSQKKGDRDDAIQTTTGVEEFFTIPEQTSLQKKVYNNSSNKQRRTLPAKSSIEKPSKFECQDSLFDNVVLTPDLRRKTKTTGGILRQTDQQTLQHQSAKSMKNSNKGQQQKQNSGEKLCVKFVGSSGGPANNSTESRNKSMYNYNQMFAVNHFRNLSLDPSSVDISLKLNGSQENVDGEAHDFSSKSFQNHHKKMTKTSQPQSKPLVAVAQKKKSEKTQKSQFLTNLQSSDATLLLQKKQSDVDVRQIVLNGQGQKQQQSLLQLTPKAYSRQDFMQQLVSQGGILHTKNVRGKSKKGASQQQTAQSIPLVQKSINLNSMPQYKQQSRQQQAVTPYNYTSQQQNQQQVVNCVSQRSSTRLLEKEINSKRASQRFIAPTSPKPKNKAPTKIIGGTAGGFFTQQQLLRKKDGRSSKTMKLMNKQQQHSHLQQQFRQPNIKTLNSLPSTRSSQTMKNVNQAMINLTAKTASSPKPNDFQQKKQQKINHTLQPSIVKAAVLQTGQTASQPQMKMMNQLKHLGHQTLMDEPVPEAINGSSCESDNEDCAIVVEERPMQEIVQGLTASSKNSPVLKDLTFEKIKQLKEPKHSAIKQKHQSMSLSVGTSSFIGQNEKTEQLKYSQNLSHVSKSFLNEQMIFAPQNTNEKYKRNHGSDKRSNRDSIMTFSPLFHGKTTTHSHHQKQIVEGMQEQPIYNTSARISMLQDKLLQDSPQKLQKNQRYILVKESQTLKVPEPAIKIPHNQDSLDHQSMQNNNDVTEEPPLTARCSTTKPISEMNFDHIVMAQKENNQDTPPKFMTSMSMTKDLVEMPLVISGLQSNEETPFELRQRKAKVKWDYLLSFVQKVRSNPLQQGHHNGNIQNVGGSKINNKISQLWWEEFNQVFNRNTNCQLSNVDEMAQKKMIDQIIVLNKRADDSEYGASNYTQITDYQIGRHLGSGAYASVKMATHKPTGMVIAIKVYEKSKLNEKGSVKGSVKREISVMKKLQHVNVMRMYDVIDSPKQLYIVLEFVQGQMLHSYIEKLLLENNLAEFTLSPASVRPRINARRQDINLKGPILDNAPKKLMAEPKIAIIFHQVLQALAFAHSKNVCHRDLKPENIMYNPRTHQVKIIDFGFACVAKDKLRVFCGTPSFMSPEIVNKKEYSGPAADVWACGILLFVMLTGQVPFKATNERDLFRKIQKGIYSFGKQETINKNCGVSASLSMQPSQGLIQNSGILHPEDLNNNQFMANRPSVNNIKQTKQQLRTRLTNGLQTVDEGSNENQNNTDLSQMLQQQEARTNNSQKLVSREAKELVKLMLTPEESRPTAKMILQTSTWLSKNTALYTHNRNYHL